MNIDLGADDQAPLGYIPENIFTISFAFFLVTRKKIFLFMNVLTFVLFIMKSFPENWPHVLKYICLLFQKDQLINEQKDLILCKMAKAEAKRQEHIDGIRKKARVEDAKLKEIAFINELNEQNARIDLLTHNQTADEKAEERLAELADERAKKAEQREAKEAAAEERRRAMEAKRMEKVQALREKIQTREERIQEVSKIHALNK